MLDSTTPLSSLPLDLDRVALYYNGHIGNLGGVVPAGRSWLRVYWIDVLGNAPADCSILDIETGDASPQTVKSWVPARLKAMEEKGQPGALCRLYSNLSKWRAVRFYVSQLQPAMQAHVRYWIANPTMTKHVVPGSAATQWYWGNMDTPPVNFDRSEVTPAWDS